MLMSQCSGSSVRLLGLAWSTDPASDLTLIPLFALLAALVAFASATQDIVIDAYRIEAVELKVQGAMAASYQTGYRRRAGRSRGPGALFDRRQLVSWQAAYSKRWRSSMSDRHYYDVLLIAEPEPSTAESQPADALEIFADGFVAWFTERIRRAVRRVLSAETGAGRSSCWRLSACYRISDMVLGVMANPFYLDVGFSLIEIGVRSPRFSAPSSSCSGRRGGRSGIVVARYGLGGPLVFGAVLLAVTNLFFRRDGRLSCGNELWFLVRDNRRG